MVCFRRRRYDDLIARDEASLDIFWLKDDSLADSDNLPPPEVIAQEVVADLEAALEQFRLIAGDWNRTPAAGSSEQRRLESIRNRAVQDPLAEHAL